ncbi:MAG: iron-containing redox enzyme family protein [Bdellovibrionales bacterium]
MEDIVNSYKTTTISKFSNINFMDQNAYKNWLAQLYYLVEHSVPMLKKAFPVCQNATIKDAYSHHIEEELGHDLLAKNDLKNLDGSSVSQFERLIETENLYKIGFESIDFDPASFVGYIMALEFTAAWCYPPILDELKSVYGEGAIQFIHEHAVADQDHIDIMLELCENMTAQEFQNTEVILDRSFNAVWALLDRFQVRDMRQERAA